jgi:hypothetical protein
MTDFDALLKRSFAEAHEPADDGFVARIGDAVARRERSARLWNAAQTAGMAAAGAAVLYGAYAFASTFGQELLAFAGLELARTHGALSAAPSVSDAAGQAQGLLQSVSAGLTQVLLIAAALAGGAVAYRATQD